MKNQKYKNKKFQKDCIFICIYNKTPQKIVKKQQILRYFRLVKQTLNLLHLKKFTFAFTFLNETEIQEINNDFRQKNKATNILTFPYQNLKTMEENALFAEFFICPTIIQQEAQEQHKIIVNHYAHMIIHGFLHAFGYDHIEAKQAEIMENLEIQILQKLNIANPYA